MSYKKGDKVIAGENNLHIEEYCGKPGVVFQVSLDSLDYKYFIDFGEGLRLWSKIEGYAETKSRKDMPVYSGVVKYFPDALLELSKVSKSGNDQHNPGSPLQWDRSKSGDELDAMTRHLIDEAKDPHGVDTDGIKHAAKIAWRALAYLQKELETK